MVAATYACTYQLVLESILRGGLYLTTVLSPITLYRIRFLIGGMGRPNQNSVCVTTLFYYIVYGVNPDPAQHHTNP